MNPAWKRHGATLLSLVISGALLVGLYRSIDVRLIGVALLKADRLWLVISIGMILPITVLRAIRFFTVAPRGALPGIGEALRLTLVASALNVVIPAKAGDLVKSYFVARRSDTSAGVAFAIVVYERLCDLFGLIFWCLLGWFIARPQVRGVPSQLWLLLAVIGAVCGVLILSERIAAVLPGLLAAVLPHRKVRQLAEGWPDLLSLLRGRRRLIVPLSLVLWITHLFQVWMFTATLGETVPFTVCASLAAFALMAGQLPFTFAGLGARDVALVVLLSGHMAPESAAAMGILIASRNLLPPLVGMPMMRPYLSSVLGEARRWRREMDPVK
jgi:glycosyltransferase 2 family protein